VCAEEGRSLAGAHVRGTLTRSSRGAAATTTRNRVECVYVRVVRRLLSWEDRRLTLWLELTLGAVAAVIVGLIDFVPWGLVGPYIARLLTFVAFGPHMYFVGKHYAKIAAEEEALADEFDAAEAAGKEALLEQEREQMLNEAVEQVRKTLQERSKFSEVERQRAEYYAGVETKFTMPRLRVVPTEKIIVVPHPERSCAVPAAEPPPARTKPPAERHRSEGGLNLL